MIVEKTGWSLEYIDAQGMGTLHEYLQVLDGREKAKSSYFNRANR